MCGGEGGWGGAIVSTVACFLWEVDGGREGGGVRRPQFPIGQISRWVQSSLGKYNIRKYKKNSLPSPEGAEGVSRFAIGVTSIGP